MRRLRDAGYPFHILSVLGRASLEMPEEMLAFFISEGIDHVCFNVEESEGDYVSDLFQGAELRQRFERRIDRSGLAIGGGDLPIIIVGRGLRLERRLAADPRGRQPV